MRYFGIDLGTSTCSVSYAVNSARPQYVPQPAVVEYTLNRTLGIKSDAVPSLVARKLDEGEAGTMLFGFKADEVVNSNQLLGRNFHNIFRSVKSDLGTGRSYVYADTSLNTPVKVWGALIRNMCDMTVEAKGPDFDPRTHATVLTVPASFQRTQRDDTLAAAKLAGFNTDIPGQVQLIDEPVAALIDSLLHPDFELLVDPVKTNNVLVFDFGGGTCDLVALKVRFNSEKPDGREVLTQSISNYHQIGGDTIDLAIMEQVVWPQVCKQNQFERENLSASERKLIEDTLRYGVCQRLKIQVNEDLGKLQQDDLRMKRWAGVSAGLSLDKRCIVQGKELLGEARLTAEELASVMEPFLSLNTEAEPFLVGESATCYPFATLVEQTLERAGMTSMDLDLVILNGGSCHSPEWH
jgi:molecular chaperone DnaK (HSP70)